MSSPQLGRAMAVETTQPVPEPAAVRQAWAPWAARGWLIRAGLLLIVGSGFVALLIGWAGAAEVQRLLLGVGRGHLVTVTLLSLSVTLFHSWRLRAVLGATGYDLRQSRAFGIVMAAWPISAFTPSKSGDLIKAYYLRTAVPVTVTAGCLLAERALDLAVLGALSLIGSVFVQQRTITVFSAAVVSAIALFFGTAPWLSRLPLRPAWRVRLDMLLSSTRALSRRPRVVALSAVLTLANWLATILAGAVLFDAVGAPVPLLYTLAALPPALFAGSLPFTAAGLGTRDSALILLFDGYATAAQALSVGLLYAFFFRWLLSLAGLPFLHRFVREASAASS